MKSILTTFYLLSILCLLQLSSCQKNHASQISGFRSYTTQKIFDAPKIDGIFNEPIWQKGQWETQFTKDNVPVSESFQTRFKIVYDSNFLYIAVQSFDPEPDSIPRYPSPRDNPSNDWVEIDFDTNLDQKTGFALSVSPYGVRTDMNIEADENFNDDWHPTWNVKTQIHDKGWNAEIKIPFDQLITSYQQNQEWGMQVLRRVVRLDEVHNWQSSHGDDGYVSQFGRLRGLNDIHIPEKKDFIYEPKKKIPIAQLREDLALLKITLEGIYPSLYSFNTKDEIDGFFSKTKSQIDQPLTDLEFYKLLAPLFSKLGDGHSSIRISENLREHLSATQTRLPLGITLVNSKAYITANWTSNKMLTKGVELLAINGIPFSELLQQLRGFVTSDGYNTTYKDKKIETNFSRLLGIAIGHQEFYKITYKGVETSEHKTTTISGLREENFETNIIERTISPLRKNYRDFHMLDSTSAYLSLRSFNGGDRFRNSIDKAFQAITENNIDNLILDLRYSYGGQDSNGSYLYSYLSTKPFQYFKKYEGNISINTEILESTDCCISREEIDFIKQVSTPTDQNTVLITNYDLTGYPNPTLPISPKENAFKGNLYLLINGANFSTSSDVSSLIHQNNRAVIIGEETGGGYFGNTSGIVKTLQLPNSRLRARIPLIKYTNDRKLKASEYGRGVFPDVTLFPSQKDISLGTDAHLAKAKELIALEP